MRNFVRALMIVCLLTCALAVFAVPASADDNIYFNVNFNTQVCGPKGGTIHLNITVFNNTSKTIDWIDFVINTKDPYNERWTGTDGVPPYCSRPNSIDVYFAPEDLDKDKILQLAINYDSDANPDDVKMQTFRINSIDEVISVNTSVDPSHGPYRSGDSVFVSHRITNNAELSAEDLVIQCILTNERGTRISDTGPINRSVLSSGESIGIPTGAELGDSDLDFVEASYALAYTYLGERYAASDVTMTLPVDEALDPDFTAELSAPFYSADLNTLTDLNLKLTNTGNVGFGSFYIEDPVGIHIANAESLGPGETMNVPIPFLFFAYDSWDMSYIITGDYGWGEHTEESNTITMVCEAPEEETPDPTETVSAAPDTPPAAQTSPDQTETMTVQPTAVPGLQEQQTENKNDNTALYIIIAVLVLLVISAAIAIPLILKGKKDNSTKRNDSL